MLDGLSLSSESVCIFKLNFNMDDWLNIFLKEDFVPVCFANALFFLFSGNTGGDPTEIRFKREVVPLQNSLINMLERRPTE